MLYIIYNKYIIINHRIKCIIYMYSIYIPTQIGLGLYTHTHTQKDTVCISQLLLCDKETHNISGIQQYAFISHVSWLLVQPHPMCLILRLNLEGQQLPGAFSSYCSGRSSRGKLSCRSILQASAPCAASANFPLVKPRNGEWRSTFCRAWCHGKGIDV